MGAKGQQAVNTIFAALAAAFLAERWDSLLFDPASPSYAANVQNMELFLIAAIGGSVSFLLEALRALALDATQGRSPRLYKLLGGTVVLLVFTGCAGGFASAPATYRDAITCSQGLSWQQTDVPADQAQGVPASTTFTVACPGKAKWSGPPSDAEVSDAAAKLKAALEALGG
jgi:hypothetical protein